MFEYTGDGCSVPKNVISVRFDDGLQKIGDGAFRDCSSLERIELPSTVTEIGYDAFHSCRNLKEVTFNVGLKKIGDGVFHDCTSLENVKLPSTVTDIGQNAFGSSRRLGSEHFACVHR